MGRSREKKQRNQRRKEQRRQRRKEQREQMKPFKERKVYIKHPDGRRTLHPEWLEESVSWPEDAKNKLLSESFEKIYKLYYQYCEQDEAKAAVAEAAKELKISKLHVTKLFRMLDDVITRYGKIARLDKR